MSFWDECAVPAFRNGWIFYALPEGSPIAVDEGYTAAEETAYWAALDSVVDEP